MSDLQRSEKAIAILLDQILDNAMRGDFKEVRKLAKRIYTITKQDRADKTN